MYGHSFGMPCSTLPSSSGRIPVCHIDITEAKLTLDKIEVECSTQPTCPSGFTASNGKCVKWKCENTPASSSSAKCEGTYQTEKCYFADYGDTKVNPDEFSLAKTSNCLLAKNQHDCNDILRLRPRDVSIHDWWTGYDLEDTDHSFYQVTK